MVVFICSVCKGGNNLTLVGGTLVCGDCLEKTKKEYEEYAQKQLNAAIQNGTAVVIDNDNKDKDTDKKRFDKMYE